MSEIGPPHAFRIRSGVAGLSNGNSSVESMVRHARTASLIAKNILAPRNSGGSPTA